MNNTVVRLITLIEWSWLGGWLVGWWPLSVSRTLASDRWIGGCTHESISYRDSKVSNAIVNARNFNTLRLDGRRVGLTRSTGRLAHVPPRDRGLPLDASAEEANSNWIGAQVHSVLSTASQSAICRATAVRVRP